MADLISRAAALDAIDGMKPMQGSFEQLAMKALCWAAVKTIQPVDAAPVVHGQWVIDTAFGNDVMSNGRMVLCSECGQGRFTGKTNYCPNCGAKMDGERRDES